MFRLDMESIDLQKFEEAHRKIINFHFASYVMSLTTASFLLALNKAYNVFKRKKDDTINTCMHWD